MRGTTTRQATMLSTLTSDSLIPLDHPIRRIKPVVEAVLADLGPEFAAMYARTGRQSVPPEHLLKATVLMALYSIRSERQFCERLRYDLLFKFFLDLNVDDEGFDHSTFSRNRERSDETPHSTTDPEARLARKGNGVAAKLSYAGHLLMENRSALIADMELTSATGYAEREAALTLLRRLPTRARRRTVAGDKGYDTRDFIAGCREMGVTPHVSQNTSNRRSAIDGRTTRHAGHVISLRIRKRVEEPFGWMKTIAGGRKLRYIGLQRNRAWFLMTGAVYNLIRITALDAQAA